MPPDNSPNSRVHQCLVQWSERFPHHRSPPITEPFEIKQNSQVQFPDADVWVQNGTGGIEAVSSETRIDILFCLEGFSFDAAYECANFWGHEAGIVRVLCQELLGPTAALKQKG